MSFWQIKKIKKTDFKQSIRLVYLYFIFDSYRCRGKMTCKFVNT